MGDPERTKLVHQLIWDYNIPAGDIEALLNGHMLRAGHYTRELLFKKVLETYPGTPLTYRFGLIDKPLSILANKLTAVVSRDEPKAADCG